MAAVSVSMSPLGQSPHGLPPVASMPALGWHQSPTSAALGGIPSYAGSHQPAFHPNAQLDLSSEAMDSDSSHDSNADYGNGEALPVDLEGEKTTSIKQEV
ncbi:hypothetical protein X975_02387, partial [Stegodyphus mimosarum]